MAAVGNVIILKWGEMVSAGGGEKERMEGRTAKRAAPRNIIILKWWEMVSLGGCVKEQMAGPCLRWLPWAM
jgi:hypothetical protein